MILVVLTAALVAGACGSDTTETGDGGSSPVTSTAPATTVAPEPSAQIVEVSGRSVATADPTVAGKAITAFATEMFGSVRGDQLRPRSTRNPSASDEDPITVGTLKNPGL